MGRVIAAGLVAGLVLNVGEAVLHGVIFAAQTAEAMKQLGHDIAGSGAGTAAGVSLILWALSAGYSAVYLGAGFAGLIPRGRVWGPVAYELVLYPVAMVAGRVALRDQTAATVPA